MSFSIGPLDSSVGRTLGRYRLLEQIGSGGMSTVFKGYDTLQHRYVALKILPPALAQQGKFTERFRREANVVLQLRHPNIVPVENFGKEDSTAYLVMPYISGGSLADLMARGPLTLAAGARILGQVASGLDYAHGRGIVHRDVKLSNILIDEHGNALLSDFGLARIQDASVSLTGSALIGTPAYMSPEQARGDPVDHRTDQYALGIILYQLATGRLPFDADSAVAVLMKQISEPMPLPRSFSPNVPVAIERVILKATAKDPDHRFGSVAEMDAAFQASLAHALDPHANPAPEIKLPQEADPTLVFPQSSMLAPYPTLVGPRSSRKWLRLAAVAAVLLLLVCALPGVASGLLQLFARAGGPAEGSADLSADQLTAQAGTIEAMSTQLVGQAGLLSPDQIETAVAQTLTAPIPSDGVGASLTPGPSPSALSPGPYNLTATWTDVPASVPSDTPVPPLPTATSPLASTPTPTHTSAPTATPTLPPTAMPSSTPSATSTPPAGVCASVELRDFSTIDNKARWTLDNQGASSIQITALSLDWPDSNRGLRRSLLGGQTIWDETDGSPPTNLTPHLKGNRTVDPGLSKVLEFRFDDDAAPTGYSVSVTLNGSCEETAEG